jgi:hypothetical protein
MAPGVLIMLRVEIGMRSGRIAMVAQLLRRLCNSSIRITGFGGDGNKVIAHADAAGPPVAGVSLGNGDGTFRTGLAA